VRGSLVARRAVSFERASKRRCAARRVAALRSWSSSCEEQNPALVYRTMPAKKSLGSLRRLAQAIPYHDGWADRQFFGRYD
jgi:hypothetical protein